MRKETRYYINLLFPGAFAVESIVQRVASKEIPDSLPKDCYGFYFSTQEVAIEGKKEFKGELTDGEHTCIVGEIVKLKDIPNQYAILRGNIERNSPTREAIRTHLGNWQIKDNTTIVLPKSRFQWTKPLIYKGTK